VSAQRQAAAEALAKFAKWRGELTETRWEYESARVDAQHAFSLITPEERAQLLEEAGYSPELAEFQTASRLLRDIEGDAT
jgi:hypothetical protein